MLKQANLSFSVAAQSFGDDVTSIQFSTQDKNTAKLIFTIREGKQPLNLTDVDAIVDLVMGDKSIFEDNKAKVTAPLDGKLEYTITADQIRHPGRARGELQLISKDGQSIGGFRFNFTVKKALVDEYAGPVKEYYINDLEAVKEDVRKKAKSTSTDIDNIKAEIEAKADSIKDLDVVRIDTKLNELEEKVGEGGVGVDEQARQGIQDVTKQLADKANEDDLNIERQRINNIIAIENSVDNAETADIRVGANGEIHASAGDNVRSIAKALTFVRSTNLFNRSDSDIVQGRYLSGDGNTNNVDSGYFTSGWINVGDINGKTIYLSQGTGGQYSFTRVAVYDDNKTTLNVSGSNIQTYTIPNGAKWLRFSCANVNFSNTQLTLSVGSIKNYEPYFSPYYDVVDKAARQDIEDMLDLLPSRNDKIVDCWGDSLTQAYGFTGYPQVLQTLLGESYKVNNLGVGSETTKTIAGRQGGMAYIVQPNVVIPGSKTAVEITMKSDDGGAVAPIKTSVERYMGVNPVTLAGIEGKLTWSNSGGSDRWYFTRNVEGESKTINRPTALLTDGMKRKKNILVIFMGQNGGWDNVPDTLVKQYKKMIDQADSNRYILLGLTSTNATSGANLEKAMFDNFGRHFINLREYLSTYGVYDVGITPTQQDLDQMAIGAVPPSLLSDTVHGNNHFYNIIGNLVHKKGKELGYWI